MIKIYDKLWFITHKHRNDNLSYMCQYEETLKGSISASTKKMQRTGRSWTGDKDGAGNIIDNVPTAGIYVGCSVSRWSTSNKLFRVEDPRGFTIEIPTDNLATLLHHTTVINGYIKDECVWGKDGGNNILLPVNSDPYESAIENKDILENKLIDIKDLKRGDCVRFFNDTNEYYFYGRVKITWRVRGMKPQFRTFYNQSSENHYSNWYELEDDKYINLFLRRMPNDDYRYYAEVSDNVKIIEIIRNEICEISAKQIYWLTAPERVRNRLITIIDTNYYYRDESEIVSIKHKEQ